MSGNNGFSINLGALPVSTNVTAPGALSELDAKVSPKSLRQTEGTTRHERVESSPPSTAEGIPHLRTVVQPASPSRPSAFAMAAAGLPGRRSSSPFNSNASPSRGMRQASPRHLSPATSQIFERDVQESTLTAELAPAIPSHMVTEDHIPAVLEASSLAITDSHLNPDDVEIVTHAAHQPAAAAVGGVGHSETHPAPSFPPQHELSSTHDRDEKGATYGTVNPFDPRRLSFISFADVVHAEHAETGKEGSLSSHRGSMAPLDASHRSPSPARRLTASERMAMPPPRRGSASASPSRAGAAGGLAPGTHGELTIETMRQTMQEAVHKERSGSVSH